jgi:hypothetical protein
LAVESKAARSGNLNAIRTDSRDKFAAVFRKTRASRRLKKHRSNSDSTTSNTRQHKIRKNQSGGERGIRTPTKAPYSLGKIESHTEKDTEISVKGRQELTRVVTVWSKLPAPLKAAILAIVNSVEGVP